jgi:hypothetical protein
VCRLDGKDDNLSQEDGSNTAGVRLARDERNNVVR